MRIRSVALVVIAAVFAPLLASEAAHAGYYMEHEAVLPNPQTMQPMRATIRSWHEGRRFKRQSPMRNEFVVIDLDKREVVGINEDTRTYWKMPSDKYRQIALMSLMVMGVKPTPDGGITVPEGLFKTSGQKGEIAGRKAYEVQVSGALPPGVATSFWLSKDVPIPISKMVDELKMMLGNPSEPGYQSLFKQWAALDGYPVQSVTTIRMPQGGTITTSETLLVYREEKIPANVFEVPKGYALTTDPLTQAEEAMRKAMESRPPAGIGAPLGATPAPGGALPPPGAR